MALTKKKKYFLTKCVVLTILIELTMHDYDADEWSNRVRVVTDVDLWVVSKTLVAGSLIGNTSSTLKIRGISDFQIQISIRSMLLENLTLTNTFC